MNKASPSDHRDETRQQRTQELLEEALQKQSPLTATLGLITADLVMIGEPIAKALRAVLEGSTDTLRDLDRHHQAMETYLKVVRQIDRLSALGQRESERSEDPAC